jgi:hypothetical protein
MIERDFKTMVWMAHVAGELMPAAKQLRLEDTLKQFAAPLHEQVRVGRRDVAGQGWAGQAADGEGWAGEATDGEGGQERRAEGEERKGEDRRGSRFTAASGHAENACIAAC